jgi:hypothetical protein
MTYTCLVCIIVVAACGEPVRPGCDGMCLQDPARRCIRMNDCSHDLDCPRGTSCTAAGTCIAAKNRTLNGSDELTLIEGFETVPMAANLDSSGTGAKLSWVAPPHAELIRCVLFTCLPEIEHGSGGLLTISNYDKCAHLEITYATLQGTFDLGAAHLPSFKAAKNDPSCPRATGSSPLLVTDLLAGCWAYDAMQLVAATRLLDVPPAGVNDPDAIPRGPTCTTNGRSCYDPDGDWFGICLDGVCRTRCVANTQCLVVSPAPRERCGRAAEADLVGGCVPAGGSATGPGDPATR